MHELVAEGEQLAGKLLFTQKLHESVHPIEHLQPVFNVGRIMAQYLRDDCRVKLKALNGRDTEKLPPAFVTALEISARDHMRMVAAVAPLIDSAISKTVNVPEDYPYEDFKDLYLEAWRAGLKGITTYRPNKVLGAVLSVTPEAQQPNDLDTSDVDLERLEAERRADARRRASQAG